MEPGIHGVRTTPPVQLARRTRIVMLMVPM
jgi:hypothetical protein